MLLFLCIAVAAAALPGARAQSNTDIIDSVLGQDKFNELFPMANKGTGPQNDPYSYTNFKQAASKFPTFCSCASTCPYELATMFANFVQEVGANDPSQSTPTWQQGLYFYEETTCEGNSDCVSTYCDTTNTQYPCVSGVSYDGRGPFQISWNYNYGAFSEQILGDASILLNDPGSLIAQDTTNGWLAFASALWFYTTAQSPRPSSHDVAVGNWQPNSADEAAGRCSGFGTQIMIINGGIECGKGTETPQAQNRISYFANFTSYFGIDAGSCQGCADMSPFDSSTATSGTSGDCTDNGGGSGDGSGDGSGFGDDED